MTPSLDAYKKLLSELSLMNERIIAAKVEERRILGDFFREHGLQEVADKITEFGLPKRIYVPTDEMRGLSWLSVICPVYGRTVLLADVVIFDFDDRHRPSVEPELVKNTCWPNIVVIKLEFFKPRHPYTS